MKQCQAYKQTCAYNRILYLETSGGEVTELLVRSGFQQRYLHPCNTDRTILDCIIGKFPNVQAEHGDIIEVQRTENWLGVWYDMEETWLCLDTKSQPWKLSRLPEFSRCRVCAVTLSARRVIGGPNVFAERLQALLKMHGGKSEQMARAYCGKSSVLTMVFALAIF